RVLVVEGCGSTRCALLGDKLALLAASNGWAGIVVNGCIRDSAAVRKVPIGVRALATSPIRSKKIGTGDRDVSVTFAGCTFRAGEWLYADDDGILIAATNLLASP